MTVIDKPLGGSELQLAALRKHIDPAYLDSVNLMLSTCSPQLLDKTKANILWQQLNVDQDAVQLLRDPNFQRRIDCFVFVSHWQYEKFKKVFGVPANRSIIIRNAVDEFAPQPKTSDKVQLIYTSTPWRGLEILLDAFEQIGRTDAVLSVYSSTKIYGESFYRSQDSLYENLYKKAQQMPQVTYHGYASNDEVKKAVAQADVFAYPSIFEETSCISAIEAGMAGCALAVTNLGALPETCSVWGNYTPFDTNYDRLVSLYAENLNCIINRYKEKSQAQSQYFQKFYGWQTRKSEWEELLRTVQ